MALAQRYYSSDEYNALLNKYNALQAENENLKENLFIMSDIKRYAALLEAKERIESGQGIAVDIDQLMKEYL